VEEAADAQCVEDGAGKRFQLVGANHETPTGSLKPGQGFCDPRVEDRPVGEAARVENLEAFRGVAQPLCVELDATRGKRLVHQIDNAVSDQTTGAGNADRLEPVLGKQQVLCAGKILGAVHQGPVEVENDRSNVSAMQDALSS